MTFKICEPAIFELIKTLVASEKAYWLAAPPNTPGPFLIFQEIDSNQFGKPVLNRTPGQPGTVQAFMQIDAYAATPAESKALGKSVEFTLDGYSGTVYHGSNSPQDSVVIGAITKQNDIDLEDRTDEPLLFRNSAVYLVTYNQ